MDPQDKKIIQETFELSKENNILLKKVRRFQNLSRLSKIFYWIVIIAIALGAFYFLQPVIEKFTSVFDKVIPGLENIQDLSGKIPNTQDFNSLKDKIGI